MTKRVCRTGVDAFYALSEAVAKSTPALPPGGLTSPERMTKAISLVEDEEEDMGTEVMMQAVELFQRDHKATIAYLAFKRKESRRVWLDC